MSRRGGEIAADKDHSTQVESIDFEYLGDLR
jgi:hypothetical protein